MRNQLERFVDQGGKTMGGHAGKLCAFALTVAAVGLPSCVVHHHEGPVAPPPPSAPPADAPQGAVNGRPRTMAPGHATACYIWREPDGTWRVRTTSKGQLHVFRGYITGASSAVGWHRPERIEFGDRIVQDQQGVAFKFDTGGHIDGLDFRPADNGCVRFNITVGDQPRHQRIRLGTSEVNPPSHHFVACP